MFTKTLLPDTLRAIQLVSGTPQLQEAYLAGGTALALHIGHRISVDLDFFTSSEFNETELSTKLASLSGFVLEGTSRGTVWGTLGGTKFSLFTYPYPLLEQTIAFQGLRLASLPDIAAMKIHAIEDRGTRRDFIDVYFLSKMYALEAMLDFYQKKYGVAEDRLYAILRSLDYFEDAEQETLMPRMITGVLWEDVKAYFRKEVKNILVKKLPLE